jgi:glycosyltransferase involved in cell wall biosynthesis
MMKVQLIRRLRQGTFDGTDNYCQGLHRLLGNDDVCRVLPVPDIPQKPSRLFHFSYEESVLRPYIAQADVVHINGYTDQGTIDAIRLAHRMGRKIVYTAHWHPFCCLGHPFLGKMFFDLKLKREIIRYVDVVTTINNEDTAFFRSFHPHVVQIPHWCDFSDPSVSVVRDPRMVLFVGRINDQVKGFGQLLALPEGHYAIHCVGKGRLPVVRRDITQHVNIPTDELLHLYRRASLLVIPSKYEAFSFVALEALSQGTPVVMSDRVRIADYLGLSKGYSVYRYGDSEDFVRKVAQTIGQEVDAARIRQFFDSRRIASTYKDLYLSLTNR